MMISWMRLITFVDANMLRKLSDVKSNQMNLNTNCPFGTFANFQPNYVKISGVDFAYSCLLMNKQKSKLTVGRHNTRVSNLGL